jgi:hypothetical protein
MQRSIAVLAAALIVVLAAYLYSQSAPHPTVKPVAPVALITAVPIAGFEKGTGPNLAAVRADFANNTWAKDRSTVTPNAATAPDGSKTAAKLTEKGWRQGRHRVETGIEGVVTPGETYTFSIFIKPAERSSIIMEMRDNPGAGGKYGFVIYDLSKRALIKQTGDITDAELQQLPDGWFRLWAAMPYTRPNVVFDIGMTEGNDAVYYGSWWGAGLFLWGPQFEKGTKPGDYNGAVAAVQ